MTTDEPVQCDECETLGVNCLAHRTRPEGPNFEGHQPSECGEHRTVGPHRAWCYTCSEWCYPTIPCKGCELPKLRAQLERTERMTRSLLVAIGMHPNSIEEIMKEMRSEA